MSDRLEYFSARLNLAMLKRGFNARDLAGRIGVSRKAVLIWLGHDSNFYNMPNVQVFARTLQGVEYLARLVV